MPGFFGNQAIRLLREFWGGVMEPGRREQGAKLLAEELYAMFQSETPLESTVPLTIYTTTGAPGLSVVNNRGGDSFAVRGGDTTIQGSRFSVGGYQGGSSTINLGDSVSTVNLGGTTVNLTPGTPLVLRPQDLVLDPNLPPPEEEGGEEGGEEEEEEEEEEEGGEEEGPPPPLPLDQYLSKKRTVFVGKVVSGAGEAYEVDLFGNGTAEGATDRVAATCVLPEGDEPEDLEAGTWLPAVHRYEIPPLVVVLPGGAPEPAPTIAYEFVYPAAGGGSTSVFLGRVVSGSGAEYVVDLFGKGTGAAATARVAATVPQIDEAETIPEGTWIAAVHKFVTGGEGGGEPEITYEFQPPVWL